MKKVFVIVFIALFFGEVLAQDALYEGIVMDAKHKTPVAYAAGKRGSRLGCR